MKAYNQVQSHKSLVVFCWMKKLLKPTSNITPVTYGWMTIPHYRIITIVHCKIHTSPNINPDVIVDS